VTYKKKALCLSALLGLLILIYGGALVFDPGRVQSREAAYTWIEPRWLPQVDRVEISRPGEELRLLLREGLWFAERDGKEYPARGLRVEDFLKALSTRAPYPVRASSGAAHERLGLLEGSASRVVLRGGPGEPLLDLLLGRGDALGSDIYLRRNGQREVRSGKDRFSVYVAGGGTSWLDLRLFPAPPGGRSPGAADVQRFTLSPPPGAGETGEAPAGEAPASEPFTLTRSGNGWVIGGEGRIAEASKTESYLRGLLGAEGEDFSVDRNPGDPVFGGGSVSLELGDGSRLGIRLGSEALENSRRLAAVSGSPYVYELAPWTVEQLFRDAGYFEQP
jgi:hypothetical protein